MSAPGGGAMAVALSVRGLLLQVTTASRTCHQVCIYLCFFLLAAARTRGGVCVGVCLSTCYSDANNVLTFRNTQWLRNIGGMGSASGSGALSVFIDCEVGSLAGCALLLFER